MNMKHTKIQSNQWKQKHSAGEACDVVDKINLVKSNYIKSQSNYISIDSLLHLSLHVVLRWFKIPYLLK